MSQPAADDGTNDAAEAPPPGKSVAREYYESLVVALVLALFVRTFVVQAFQIPTVSMEDNLLVGDHLLVNKVAYSASGMPFEDALLGKRAVQRGHVVVFKFPGEAHAKPDGQGKDFIKRVIGLPGETIEIRAKRVYVDGRPLDEPYVRFVQPPPHPGELVYGLGGTPERDDWGPRLVPPGHLFVLGDNRDKSSDSRFWGFLPADRVKGRALLIYWSYEQRPGGHGRPGALAWVREALSAFGRTRWERLFHVIR